MTHTKHHHPDPHERNSGGEYQVAYWKRIHHDWKFWIALVLMLTAMAAYVMSIDLSVQPTDGNKPQLQQPVP